MHLSSVGGRLGEGELLSHRPYPADDPCLHSLIRGAGRITVPNDLWVCIQEIRRAVPPNPPEYYAVPGSAAPRCTNGYPAMVPLVYFSPTTVKFVCTPVISTD